jgi:hypothetical protein
MWFTSKVMMVAVKTMEGVKSTSINPPSASIQFVSLVDKAAGA